MKASFRSKYGNPDVLQFIDVPTPIARDNEILIKIHATTVNRTDSGFLTGKPHFARLIIGFPNPKNKILGCEFAGQVESVGNGVTLFRPGDRVFGYDEENFGGHAEYKTMKENGPVALIPEGMSYSEAAPLTEGSHYALCDIRAAKVLPGQQVMVYGATGAIGSAAVQLVKATGAEVTAVGNTKNLALLRSLGADEVVDYTQQDFTKTDTWFDFIFDAVGKSSFGACKPMLKKRGIYISTELGPGSQNPFLAMLSPFSRGKKVLFPIPTINKEDVLFLRKLAVEKKFRPVIDRQYPFVKIVDAFTYVLTGQKTGNVVISMD
ncbi:MAG: NAD(P)-dependent alcohol dehydrogenase [Cyclobacteriaceae bacterium]|nr:NAD(P)-dependent alcohol dehydrogenase [Cyclobacteriaceae bacterium]